MDPPVMTSPSPAAVGAGAAAPAKTQPLSTIVVQAVYEEADTTSLSNISTAGHTPAASCASNSTMSAPPSPTGPCLGPSPTSSPTAAAAVTVLHLPELTTSAKAAAAATIGTPLVLGAARYASSSSAAAAAAGPVPATALSARWAAERAARRRHLLLTYGIMPLVLPLLVAYYLVALTLAVAATLLVTPSLLAARRLYWACPFIPCIWARIRAQYGWAASWYVRISFEVRMRGDLWAGDVPGFGWELMASWCFGRRHWACMGLPPTAVQLPRSCLHASLCPPTP